jgi:glycosyltransferase involved in cell wall biosynthesis
MTERQTILLIYHKPLRQLDGNVKYTLKLIKALSRKYDIVVPSEGLFERTARLDSLWLLRTFIVNLYLILWIILHLNSIRCEYKFAIMEDRYVIFPSLIIKSFGINIISLISDWGRDYSKSIDLGSGNLQKLFLRYSAFYETFVKRYSRGVIVPSENMKKNIEIECKCPVIVFPFCIDSKIFNSQSECNLNFTDDLHDIYCVLVGNFSYPANLEMAQFIIYNVARKALEKDRRIKFVIVGKDSDLKFGHLNIENVAILGVVRDLECVYSRCQIGLNSTNVPGGTSSKNIEYLTNGLYVVGTPQSSLGIVESENFIISSREDFSEAILNVADLVRSKGIKKLAREAERIREYYSFERNAEKLVEFVSKILMEDF